MPLTLIFNKNVVTSYCCISREYMSVFLFAQCIVARQHPLFTSLPLVSASVILQMHLTRLSYGYVVLCLGSIFSKLCRQMIMLD